MGRKWIDIAMLNLTRQQRIVMSAAILLLVLGWTVKAWRTAHPSRPEPASVRP
jgi:hypothetical protein